MNVRNLGHCFLGSIKGTRGPSMLPTIDERGNLFIVERISTRFGKVDRGDVVCLRHPQNPCIGITKRVIGLEGDRLRHCSNTDTYILVGDAFAQNNDEPQTIVVSGAVWVEGDNKNQSLDSRKFGPISYGLIMSRLFWRILPYKQFGSFWDK